MLRVILFLFGLWLAGMTHAQGKPNLPLKTLGGKQFWTDFAWNDGWRLQQSAITKHWRVLDPKNIRRAWGSREACWSEMQQRVESDREPETHLIVLLHGLLRSSSSMIKMADAIAAARSELAESRQAEESQQSLGRPVMFSYASTRLGIAEHSAALLQWIESLPGQPRIDFVCHSMGNIVVRHFLGGLERDGDPIGLKPQFGQMVMLGPPNQGADLARRLSKLGLFEIVTGQGGMELGPAWETFQDQLATPDFPFIIVAGDTSQDWISNPLVEGPSDLLVRIDEAKLDGSQDFHVVPVLHTLLMSDKDIQKIVVEFLLASRL